MTDSGLELNCLAGKAASEKSLVKQDFSPYYYTVQSKQSIL